MAGSNSLTVARREYESYTDTVNEQSIEITLGTAGVITVVTLPDAAKGFKLYPKTTSIQFAASQSGAARTVVQLAIASGTTVAANAFGVGGIAKNDQWEIRQLPTGTTRTLSLISATNAQIVDLEVF